METQSHSNFVTTLIVFNDAIAQGFSENDP
jgi:hypothetical protein